MRLQAQIEAQAQQVNQAMVGTVLQRVLVEGHAAKNAKNLAGPHRQQNRIVNFAGRRA